MAAEGQRKDHPELTISDQTIDLAVDELRHLLSNEYGLYLRTRTTHWMVESPQFSQYHLLFEKQYMKLDKIIDSVAERIRQLGKLPLESLKQYTKFMTVDECVSGKSTAAEMIDTMAVQHETVIKQIRGSVKKISQTEDYGTADILTKFLEKHEKMVWLLRSHLANAPGSQ